MNNETMLLLERHFDVAFAAHDGIKKLRELILTLAMQGKLVPQDPNDEPASELLKAIELEKQQMLKDGKIKQPKPLPKIKTDHTTHNLPNGWQWVRLGEVANYNGRKNIHSEEISPETWLLDLEDIEKDTSRIIYRAQYSERQSKSTKSTFQKGDVLYGKLRPYLNKVVVADIDGVCTTEIVPIVLLGNIDSQFFKWLLKRASFLEHVNSLMYGVKMPRLGTDDANMSIHPLPPIAEQKRIVAEIDRLMARCDELEKLRADRSQKLLTVHTAALDNLLKAKESSDFSSAWHFITQNFSELYSVKENVAELRKAILQLAVMGKLVPQDPNDEPSSVLVARIKAERNSSQEKAKKDSITKISNIPFQIPSSWKWQRVTDLYEVAGGIQKTPQRTPVSNFFPYLRVANVQRGRLDLTQIEYFELFDGELEKRSLQSGDLLIVEGNGSDKEIGRCAIWNGEIDDCVHQNHIIRARPIGHDGQLFTLVFLNSPCGMAEMKSLAITTSGLYSLSVGKIREILIPFPPLAEQHRIVAEIDRLMGMCDRLEESIEAAKGKQTDLLNALMSQV
jgi:type I restriction enzyme, S subunit